MEIINNMTSIEPIDENPYIIEEEISSFDFEYAINDAIFKLKSHSEPLLESASNLTYDDGFENGIAMAIDILESIVRRSK